MDNNQLPKIDPKNELPIPHDMQLEAQQQIALPKPVTHAWMRWLFVGFVILFLILLLPIPYYQPKSFCKPGGLCPQEGWYLGESLLEKTKYSLSVLNVNTPTTIPTHPPSIPTPTTIWKTYTNYALGFSFQYPSNFLLTEKSTIFPKQLTVSVSSYKINDLHSSLGYDKETALKDRAQLEKGNYGETMNMDFRNSRKVIKLGDQYVKTFMVLSELDACNVQFVRKLLFYKQDSLVIISVAAPQDVIIKSTPEYFKTITDCGEEKVWIVEKKKEFYETLVSGQGTSVAQQWFDSFDYIISTFESLNQTENEGKFCGGIAGLECPDGYQCRLDGNYPDAGGKCVRDNTTSQICGGPVLTPCPEGYSCKITTTKSGDVEEESGICIKQ